MLFIITLVILKCTSAQVNNKIKYTWRQENDNLDFIVGISVNDTPVCAGVIITKNIILTSVNPLIGFYKLKIDSKALISDKNVKVHVIYKDWDTNYAVKAVYAYPQFLSCTNSSKPEIDRFGKGWPYTPTHDLMTLTIELSVTYATVKSDPEIPRYPLQIDLYTSNRLRIKPNGTFTVAGFGFVDNLHVKQNYELEAVDYRVQRVLVDCDEWIPKPWGLFICLYNIENFVGIDSGGTLMHNGKFIGMGSFSLLRGNESILVFTDIRKYKTLFSYSEGYPKGTIWPLPKLG